MEERRQLCVDHKKRTEKIEDAIFGNGRAGLISDVAQVKVTNKIILTLNIVMLGAVIKLLFFGA